MAENARLEFNDEQGRRVVRIEKEVFTVGRRTGNDLHLTGPQISRDHAEIVLHNGHYAVRDLVSRYGTFVNSERVTERKLAHLDRLRFGLEGPELLFIEQGAGAVARVTDLAVGDLRQVSMLLEGLRAIGTSRVLDDILALVLDSAIDVSGPNAALLCWPIRRAGWNSSRGAGATAGFSPGLSSTPAAGSRSRSF